VLRILPQLHIKPGSSLRSIFHLRRSASTPEFDIVLVIHDLWLLIHPLLLLKVSFSYQSPHHAFLNLGPLCSFPDGHLCNLSTTSNNDLHRGVCNSVFCCSNHLANSTLWCHISSIWIPSPSASHAGSGTELLPRRLSSYLLPSTSRDELSFWHGHNLRWSGWTCTFSLLSISPVQ